MRYRPLLYQQSRTPLLLEATWGVCALVVWNKAASEQLITNNRSWLEETNKICHQKRSGIFETQAHFLELPTERILP